MNLHQLVRSSINSVNPETSITIRKFSNYEVDEAGKVTNTYKNYNPDLGQTISIKAMAQIQPISGEKLEHLYNYNSSNTYVKIFVNGQEHGLSEPLKTNGDLVIFENRVWLIVETIGLWNKSGWNEVILCLQKDKSLTEDYDG